MLSWWNSLELETVSKRPWLKMLIILKLMLKRLTVISSWRNITRHLKLMRLDWKSILKINCVNKEYKRLKWQFSTATLKKTNNKELKELCKILKFNKFYKLQKLEMLFQIFNVIQKPSITFLKIQILLKNSINLSKLVFSEQDETLKIVYTNNFSLQFFSLTI